MTEQTEPRSQLSYGWTPGESGWGDPMNANLLRIGRFGFHPSVKSRALTAPPGSPVNGDAYIPAAGATGAWAGHAGEVAVYDGGWAFAAPRDGFLVHVADADGLALYDGGAWSADVLRADRLATAWTHSQATGNAHSTTAAQVGALPLLALSGAIDFNSINGGAPCVATGDGTSYANSPYLGTQLVGYGGTLYQGSGVAGSITQLWADVRTGSMYYRGKTSGTWGAWVQIHDGYNTPISTFAKTLLDDTTAAQMRATIGVAKAPSKVDVSASANLGSIDASAIKVTATDVTLTCSGGFDGQAWDVICPDDAVEFYVPTGAKLYRYSGITTGPATYAPGGGRALRVVRVDASTWIMPNLS